MKKKLNYFRYITLPTFLWRYSGWEFIDNMYSYYWLNIKHRKQIWEDADEQCCERRWCRYCGKGRV
jgi:hypothetical protein